MVGRAPLISALTTVTLNLVQEISGNLADRNKRTASKTGDCLRSILPDFNTYIREGQGLWDREVLRKSATVAHLLTWLIIHVQLLGSANKQTQVKFKASEGTGEGVLKIFLM